MTKRTILLPMMSVLTSMLLCCTQAMAENTPTDLVEDIPDTPVIQETITLPDEPAMLPIQSQQQEETPAQEESPTTPVEASEPCPPDQIQPVQIEPVQIEPVQIQTDQTQTDQPLTEQPAQETAPDLQVTITSSNGNALVHPGDTVVLTAHVTGADEGAYTLQWQMFEHQQWNNIPGETNPSLTIRTTLAMDGWQWRVVVTLVEA